MNYLTPDALTDQLVKDARDNEVAVRNSHGEIFLVRLLITQPGYLVRSAQSQAVVYVLTLAEVFGFCRSDNL